MNDANKPVVWWEELDAYDIFERLVDRLPLTKESRDLAMTPVSCGETEAGISHLLNAADGVIPYEVYLDMELNRDILDSIDPYLSEDYERMLEHCTVADPYGTI